MDYLWGLLVQQFGRDLLIQGTGIGVSAGSECMISEKILGGLVGREVCKRFSCVIQAGFIVVVEMQRCDARIEPAGFGTQLEGSLDPELDWKARWPVSWNGLLVAPFNYAPFGLCREYVLEEVALRTFGRRKQ